MRVSPKLLAASGLGVLLVGAVSLGQMLGWSPAVRVAVVSAILVLALVVVVVKLVRGQRHAKGIEQAMFAQASQQQQTARRWLGRWSPLVDRRPPTASDADG